MSRFVILLLKLVVFLSSYEYLFFQKHRCYSFTFTVVTNN